MRNLARFNVQGVHMEKTLTFTSLAFAACLAIAAARTAAR
jgi:hypothetical protein